MMRLILATLFTGTLAFAAVGKMQNIDFATSAQITGAGGVISQLLNTSKIYDSTNAQLLDTTIAGKQPTLSTSASVANQFLTAFTAPNTFSRAQPDFTNLSGVATNAQFPTYTNHVVLLGTGAPGIGVTAVGSSNTLLHGNTGADPTYSAVVNGDITNGTIDLTAKVTGALPVANGGTGQSSYTDGQILIGKTTGNTLTKTTLTAGANITITNGSGAITIAASGAAGVGDSGIYVDTGNGRGSTNTRVRRFTNSRHASGSDITYADSATLGASATINTAGGYAVTYCDSISSGVSNIAISVNGSALTTNASSITYAQGLRAGAVVDNATNCVSTTLFCAVNDVIRPQEDANTDGTNQRQIFSVTRMY